MQPHGTSCTQCLTNIIHVRWESQCGADILYEIDSSRLEWLSKYFLLFLPGSCKDFIWTLGFLVGVMLEREPGTTR